MKKAVAVIGAVCYLVSPIDLVPDVIPIIGWLDDVGVLALLASYLAKRPEDRGTV